MAKDQSGRNGYVIGRVQGLQGSEFVPEGVLQHTFNIMLKRMIRP